MPWISPLNLTGVYCGFSGRERLDDFRVGLSVSKGGGE